MGLAAGFVTLASAWGRARLASARGFDPDEFEHLHGGWCLAHGLWPYRDYFEHHTPWLHLALAPLVAWAKVDADPDAAVRFVFAARAAMWVVATIAIVLTFVLARRLTEARTAWVAAALLGLTVAFVEKTAEVRPDGPAVVCLLASWAALLAGLRRPPHSRAARLRLLGAGLLLGSAIMLTQKALFALPGTGAVLAWWSLDPREGGTRAQRSGGMLLFAAGVVLPLAATLALFAPHVGGRAFLDSNFGLNARWPFRFSPMPLIERMTQQNAVLLVLAAAGLLRTVLRLGRSDAIRSGDALVVFSAVALIAGAFIVPSPYLQYYAMVLPLVAMLAARFVVDAADWIASASGRFSAGASAMVATVLLAAAVLHPAALLRAELRPAWPKVEDQLARIRLVMTATRAEDTVMDGFTGAGVFRPHAWPYFFLHDEIRAGLGASDIARLRADLRDGQIAPEIVLYDDDLRALPLEITSFVEENYAPAGDRVVWRRKDLALDGPGSDGRLDLGQGPSAVLVGRGWSAPESRDGRWVRAMQGSRSTLRVPLMRAAGVEIVVSAWADSSAGGRLRVAVNETETTSRPLVAGWSDYTFAFPAVTWRAGINRVRLTRDGGGALPSVLVERLVLVPGPPSSATTPPPIDIR